jgi:hypothetical protein
MVMNLDQDCKGITLGGKPPKVRSGGISRKASWSQREEKTGEERILEQTDTEFGKSVFSCDYLCLVCFLVFMFYFWALRFELRSLHLQSR